jgi:prepilin-type processing-associated H-X9-DG protein
MSLIGILAALLFPALGRAKEAGRATACLSNLHQIGIALQLYVQDNQNHMPYMRDASTDTNFNATNLPPVNIVLSNHLGSVNVLRCPSDRQQLFETTGSSYSWTSLLNGEDADHLSVFNLPLKDNEIPVMYDKEQFHKLRGPSKAVNYLYADGHIKNLLEIAGSTK